MKHSVLLAFLLVSCAAQQSAPVVQPVAQAQCNPGLALVNAALWVQSSAEYRANALQTYGEARRALDALVATTGDKPPAVVLDLDETALANNPYEARMIKAGKTYDEKAWQQWTNEAAATAVPGAAEFLTYARSRGVTPFYVTNRNASEKSAVRTMLQKLGYPLDANEDQLLMRSERPEWTAADKTSRRDYIAQRYRILLLLGDDLNDFTAAAGKSLAEREALVRDNASKWGTTWFILPNPMYGSWEAAMTAGGGTPCDQLNRKIEALKP